MRKKIQSLWESMRTSFWFMPGSMMIAAVILAYAVVLLDRAFSLDSRFIADLFYSGGPEGARLVLSTIAGSTIAVAGVTFSITIAAMTMASAQFGPRMLRNFMADKANQFVLGAFIATFIYCLLVLRTIRDDSAGSFVPEIAVTLGIGLALVSMAVLIYFFHHLAASVQPEQIVHTMYCEVIAAIKATFPEPGEDVSPPDTADSEPDAGAALVLARTSGYIQAVDADSLVELAAAHDLLIHLLYRPGEFVFQRTPLARVAGDPRDDPDIHKRIRKAFVVNTYRSMEQDVEFPVQQLVDMALRALSPSLNDPYTAVNCVDRLAAAVCLLNTRGPARSHYRDDEGNLRLVRRVSTYEGLLHLALAPIRRRAGGSVTVTIRLLEALHVIAATACTAEQRQIIRAHLERVRRTSRDADEQKDREDIQAHYQAVVNELDHPRPLPP